MSGCCDPSGYDSLFGPKEARRALRAYDRSGLNRMARRTVDYLESRGVEGHRILEVGGGIGAVQIELLKAGAASAVNVEISRGYQEVASELLRREGLEGRVEQKIGDFTELAAEMQADDVIMNRVICCYPDMEGLMNAGLSASTRFLAAVYPRDGLVWRIAIRVENTYHRFKGVGFRTYLHSPEAIVTTANRAGFEVAFADRDLGWHGVVFERVA
ncbi:MAG TPA: methyltransferase domain-containing protein [Acidimicrobiia bacterium]|nr:methyltransferase domain-containing protein [Acidimicrobiia bacterium]